MDLLQFVVTVTVGHITVGNITLVCGYSWQKLQITFYTCLLTFYEEQNAFKQGMLEAVTQQTAIFG